ncbi:chorismate mutase [Lachnospiraceae bacterium G11]|jgi:monofunctional chorismate mutase|nr:chorismate mutase [Lachnospiraceae bacterium G11]
MELKELRASIDVIDRQIVELFEKRMDVSVGIALAKKEAGLPIYDPKREEEKLKAIESLATKEEYKPFLKDLYVNLFAYSKELQNKVENNEK